MRRILIIALGALCATLSLSPVSAQTARDDCAKPDKQLLAEGCKLLDEFMAAFNDSDAEKFAATNNYPHIRITGPKVTIWNTAADYMRDNSRAELLAKETHPKFPGWKISKWDWRRLVQQSDETLHYAVQFSRVDAAGKAVSSFRVFLYFDQERWPLGNPGALQFCRHSGRRRLLNTPQALTAGGRCRANRVATATVGTKMASASSHLQLRDRHDAAARRRDEEAADDQQDRSGHSSVPVRRISPMPD